MESLILAEHNHFLATAHAICTNTYADAYICTHIYTYIHIHIYTHIHSHTKKSIKIFKKMKQSAAACAINTKH